MNGVGKVHGASKPVEGFSPATSFGAIGGFGAALVALGLSMGVPRLRGLAGGIKVGIVSASGVVGGVAGAVFGLAIDARDSKKKIDLSQIPRLTDEAKQ